ncbi:zf-HC2 domain-containing protein [Streptomyces sp. NBC_01321]|uniref:zf-HC2 domain-containing protein n=1 Tax=Streptomyces sp. NBC_01321 TaxID=2903825 RepID=UPI002E0F222F|nr:zf-HC2 domain-containing protein [Streptomyces sp. NBC_01321]
MTGGDGMRRGSGLPHWHVGDELAGRYAAGSAAETEAWSLEKHVETCEECAARVSAAVRARRESAALLDGVRAGVLAAVASEVRPERGPARSGTDVPGQGFARRDGDVPDRRPSRSGTGVPGQGPARSGTHVPDRRPARSNANAPDRGSAPNRRIRFPASASASRAGRLLWAAGPALRGAWLLALVLVAVGALALAYGAGLGTATRPLLLVIAPVLPLAGVLVSYGRHSDPMHEIAAATPSGGLRLLLTRTAAVLGASIPALTLAGAALPPSAGGPGPAAWLLPGLAMTLAALALGSYVGCRNGASSVAVAWAAAVLLPAFVTSSAPGIATPATEAARYFAGPAAQGGWAAGALGCAVLLVVRRRSFDHLETL